MVESSPSFKDRLNMLQWWLDSHQGLWHIVILIVLGTYLIEDAAIISAALLSVDGFIAQELALYALFFGVFTGDLSLYGVGKLLNRWEWFSRRFNSERIKQTERWLHNRRGVAIFSARLIPGLRLPTYMACGYFNLSFVFFFLVVGITVWFWTAFVFYSIYWLGHTFWVEWSGWKWFFLPVIIGSIIIFHKMVFGQKAVKNWSKHG